MLAPWKKSYGQPRQRIKKQRHCFANKGPSNQSYGFSNSNVWMWELDCMQACSVASAAAKSLSRVRLCATPPTVAHQAPPSMGLSRQEYWRGCHSLLQKTFPTRGLLHCKWIRYHWVTWEALKRSLQRRLRKGWTPKSWCFRVAVLEKTLESPLDCKIKPVEPKGNQPWILKEPTHWKRLMLGKIVGKRRRGWQHDIVIWHHWLNGHEFEQTPGQEIEEPGMLQSLGSKRVGHDLVTERHKKCAENRGRAWESPGGPVVRTLCSHGRGPRFDPWLGN